MSILKITNNGSSLKTIDNFSFLSSETRLAFSRIRQVFTKAPIFYHFNLKRYISIKTDTFSYDLGDILSQLISEFNQ